MTTINLYTRVAVIGLFTAASAAMIACASTTQFDRAVNSHRWSDAATALSADSSLLQSENTLFQAAMLYSFPNRATYDPSRARALFERLLKQYPATPRRQAAIDQLSLLYELQRVDNTGIVKLQALQSKISQLEADTLRLHSSMDSVATQVRAEQDQSAVLRKVTTRLQNDLMDRESQLSALHNELNHLKAIDLRPPVRPPLRSQGGDTALKKPIKP